MAGIGHVRDLSTGRFVPPEYDPAIGAMVCELIANDYRLRQIEKFEGMPSVRTIFYWLSKYPEFNDLYQKAKEDQADFHADEIVSIADEGTNDWMEREGVMVPNHEHINRSRLRVDTRKWLMTKILPKKYGDKQTHQHEGSLEISWQAGPSKDSAD